MQYIIVGEQSHQNEPAHSGQCNKKGTNEPLSLWHSFWQPQSTKVLQRATYTMQEQQYAWTKVMQCQQNA